MRVCILLLSRGVFWACPLGLMMVFSFSVSLLIFCPGLYPLLKVGYERSLLLLTCLYFPVPCILYVVPTV